MNHSTSKTSKLDTVQKHQYNKRRREPVALLEQIQSIDSTSKKRKKRNVLETPQNMSLSSIVTPSSSGKPSPIDIPSLSKEKEWYQFYKQQSFEQQQKLWDALISESNRQLLWNLKQKMEILMSFDIIGKLPNEISVQIFSYLDLQSLGKCLQVCKKWKEKIETDAVIWKQKIHLYGWSDRLYKYPLNQPEDYMKLFKYFTLLKRNWFRGQSVTTTFPVLDTRVITSLVFDQQRVICGSEEAEIYIFDIQKGTLITTLEGHEGGVWCLETCGPDQKYLISASTDRTIKIWHLDTFECLQTLKGHASTIRCMQLIPKPKHMHITREPDSSLKVELNWSHISHNNDEQNEFLIITGSRDKTAKVWYINLEQLSAQQKPKPKIVYDIMHQDEPEQADSEDSDEEISLQQSEDSQLSSMQEEEEPETITSQENKNLLFTLKGHSHSVRTLFANEEFVITGSYDNSVIVWSITSGKLLHHLLGHKNRVYSVCYNEELRQVYSSGLDNSIKVWQVDSGECLTTLEGHTSLIGLMQLKTLSFKPQTPFLKYHQLKKPINSSQSLSPLLTQKLEAWKEKYPKFPLLISGAADGALRLWDMQQQKCIQDLLGHSGVITCFQFDSDKIVSGSEGSIRVWDTKEGLFVRDMMVGIQNAWKIGMDERRCICAVQRQNHTWIEVIDFEPRNL